MFASDLGADLAELKYRHPNTHVQSLTPTLPHPAYYCSLITNTE